MDIHLDIETYSECDLKKCGLYRYAEDPSTEILIAVIQQDDKSLVFDLTRSGGPEHFSSIMQNLVDALDNIFWAHNAAFERILIRIVLGIDIPIHRWRCTQVLGYEMAFTGGLGDMVASITNNPDAQKDPIGRKLINRFSKPQPKSHNVPRWTRENDPEQWAQFISYCEQDVVAERTLHRLLIGYEIPEFEWDLYHLDQEINDRGLPVDRDLIAQAIKAAETEKKILLSRMKQLTNLPNPGSNDQLLRWLQDRGCEIQDMQKDTLTATLGVTTNQITHEVLDLKLQYAKASVAKWQALDRSICKDGRIHGAFHFGGASRTMRWAGRIFQPQNLPRPVIANTDAAADLLIGYGHKGLDLLHGEVMMVLSSLLRAAVKAPVLMDVSDLSSIESRVLGWFTGCQRIMDIFASGRDTYKDMATQIFNRPYDQVTKSMRTFAKPVVLGGGYGLGAKGLMGYAEGFGLELTEKEAQDHVNAFRETYHEIPAFWTWIKDSVFRCVQTGCTVASAYFRIEMQGEFLRIRLPSGRYLSYHRPEIIKKEAPWGDVIDNFSFMGINRFTMKWERITMHAGGITENICQAIARDILGAWLLRAQEAGFNLFLHVHDELGALVTESRLQELNDLIRKPISWAPGLVLDADGYTSTRYKKG
jgi:DNA polymerase bacteriophage-type